MEVPQKSILKDCMRDAYETFVELLLVELSKTHPRDKRTPQKIKEAMKKVIDKEFGKDRGGALFMD
jgi:hypothetical protein